MSRSLHKTSNMNGIYIIWTKNRKLNKPGTTVYDTKTSRYRNYSFNVILTDVAITANHRPFM